MCLYCAGVIFRQDNNCWNDQYDLTLCSANPCNPSHTTQHNYWRMITSTMERNEAHCMKYELILALLPVWLGGNGVLHIETLNQVNTKMVTICRCIILSLNQPSWSTQPGQHLTGRHNEYWQQSWLLLEKKYQFLHNSMLCYQDCWRTDLIS